MAYLLIAMLLLAAVSEDRYFINTGNNVGVPVSSVRKYAQDHKISFEEARIEIGQENR